MALIRRHGWQLPWHPFQIIAFAFIVYFGVVYFGILVRNIPYYWRGTAYVVVGVLLFLTVVLFIVTTKSDASDPNVKHWSADDRPQGEHAKAIVDNFCYICQVQVGPKSKHCRACDKCVSNFDHHCKWLNNCVGGRNYRLFIMCLTVALLAALAVTIVAFYLFIRHFVDSDARGAYDFFGSTGSDDAFAAVAGVTAFLALLAVYLVGQLFFFHMYLIHKKLTTYDYILLQRAKESNAAVVPAKPAVKEEATKEPQHRFKNKVHPDDTDLESGISEPRSEDDEESVRHPHDEMAATRGRAPSGSSMEQPNVSPHHHPATVLDESKSRRVSAVTADDSGQLPLPPPRRPT
eukprot:Opistho-2@87319